MDYMNVLTAALILGVMGIVFGILLAYASKKFAVEVDARIPEVREVLPGANCGACGFPGCDGFAAAVVAGNAKVNGCPVGGAPVGEKVAKIMGLAAESTLKKVAKVMCNAKCFDKYQYAGYSSCTAASMLSGGSPKSCSFGCIGLGTCVKVCAFDAIKIGANGVAYVDKDKCTSCNKCIEACPKGIIKLIPYEQFTIVNCSNTEIGGHVKKNCDNACIACRMCERNCPHDAIHVVNNVAIVDFDKCVNCGICVAKCPTKAIEGVIKNPPQEEKKEEKKEENGAEKSGEQSDTAA